MSFDIFDEDFYLATNPDVAAAVASGALSSGLQHFQTSGLAEGRTSVSSLYSETLYLQANPDVVNAVNAGLFSSGLEHYIRSGEAEGRLGNTGLYNESAYLRAYPDIAAAVNAGVLSSGFQHFVNFVLPEDSEESRYDALFNERYYLAKYPDVANAVANGILGSGLQHFVSSGVFEGRRGGFDFNEGFYLRDNPDIANAVANGVFSSGLSHFVQFGEAEGRSGTYFDESLYRTLFPDVSTAISAGFFFSGYEHYLKFGQFEEDRFAAFTGTSGNDIIRSFGGDADILGVSVSSFNLLTEQVRTGSLGRGEVDILIGASDGEDSFVLGNPTTGDIFYLGQGNNDYALIRSFDRDKDSLTLAGNLFDYSQSLGSSGSLEIRRAGSLDLIAIVEGVAAPLQVDFSTEVPGGFALA